MGNFRLEALQELFKVLYVWGLVIEIALIQDFDETNELFGCQLRKLLDQHFGHLFEERRVEGSSLMHSLQELKQIVSVDLVEVQFSKRFLHFAQHLATVMRRFGERIVAE